MAQDRTDVIVIGAGFTGLSAAQALLDRGLSVVLLEARPHVGGRVRSFVAADGRPRDAGGQFICDDMPVVTELVHHFGLDRVETRWKGEGLTVPEVDALAEHVGARRSDERTSRLYADMDEADPDDPRLGGLSIAGWLERQDAPDEAKQQFLSMVHGLWCRPADDIPFWYLRESDRRNTAAVSELQYFLKDGIAALAEAMAAPLRPHLRLSTPVSLVVRDRDGLRVETDSENLLAHHVLIAVPPVRAGAILHQPPLPDTLQAALSAWRSGDVVKVLVRYARRVWPTSLSSGISWRDVSGLFAFDVSVSEQDAAFVVFIGGPLAIDWRQRGANFIADEVRRRMEAVLGPEVGEPLEIVAHDWTDDRWSGGGYSDVIVDANARDAEAVLLAGAPGVSFASSELSPSFPSYIEGAIIAGRAAAARIADILSLP